MGEEVVVPADHGRRRARSHRGSTDRRWALLAMRASEPPTATWVIGGDDSRDGYTVLYADSRGESRVHEMTLDGRRRRRGPPPSR